MELETLLKQSIEIGASDLHITAGLPPLVRLNGDLKRLEGAKTLASEQARNLVYSVMSKTQLQIFESKLLIDMSVNLPDVGIFRVSAFHQLHGVAAVFRVVPDKVPTIDDLGLPPLMKRFSILPHGLVLVVGPTGSGKSTTLASIVDYINQNRKSHIITIEDPVEFVHVSKKSAVNQIQVGRDTPSFDLSLRAALRQDPDVILVGEMRDLETIRLALTAAETGHLVLSTLHASTAPLAISRMVDVFPAHERIHIRTQLAETMQAIICQNLVKAEGRGRVAALEVMLGVPSIRHYIQQDMIAHMETAMQTNNDIGMCTMAQYLQKLVAAGRINSATAKSVAANRESFSASFRKPTTKNGK